MHKFEKALFENASRNEALGIDFESLVFELLEFAPLGVKDIIVDSMDDATDIEDWSYETVERLGRHLAHYDFAHKPCPLCESQNVFSLQFFKDHMLREHGCNTFELARHALKRRLEYSVQTK